MHSDPSHLEKGRYGEQLAAEYLQNAGLHILERNWRHSKCEIDLIAREGEALVFIEVKTRSSDYFGPPEAFVSEKKERMMQEAASVYMEAIGHDWEVRFDIVSVLLHADGGHQLEHFRDAFF
ncbi:MAG TPA: YraN family protein [Saprospiraceae bacterium]|nr:YraN family protein [Saprospiraceae bacterium]